jgi:hypothetical protein
MLRSFPVNEATLDKSSHDIGEGRAVNSGHRDQFGLAWQIAVRDRGQHRILSRGQLLAVTLDCEDLCGPLAGTVKKVKCFIH